jgi:hypothetical protein
MSKLHEYSQLVEYQERQKTISYASIALPPEMPLKESLLKTKVLIGEVHRPDKIAYRLYQNATLSWIIDEANKFYNGFSEYTFDREIYYPSLQALNLMGITATEDI